MVTSFVEPVFEPRVDWYRSHGYDFLTISDHNRFHDITPEALVDHPQVN